MLGKIDRIITTVDNFKHHKLSLFFEAILKGVIEHITKNKLNTAPKCQQYPCTSDELQQYFIGNKKYNPDSIPFENYADEPVYVKNLKDTLNAIYLLQKTFEDLEAIEIRDGDNKICKWYGDDTDQAEEEAKRWWHSIIGLAKGSIVSVYYDTKHTKEAGTKLWNETIPKAYQACHLLTHLDFSLLGAFAPEGEFLKNTIIQLSTFWNQIVDYSEITPKKVQNWVQPEQLGQMAGEGLYHLKSDGGSIDINFLTQLGVSLPSFFQELTDSLQKLNPDLANIQSSVSRKELDSFQELAEKILVATHRLKNRNSLTFPLHVLHYIHLIEDISALGRGVVEHFALANETSQEVVIDKLRKLKHEHITSFLIFLDKIERELMLKPGTLSGVWMKVLEDYWQTVIGYVNNGIELQKESPDLLILNDANLMRCRLTVLANQIDRYKSMQAVESRWLAAFYRFYRHLDDLADNCTITPGELTHLAKDYKLIQGYVIAQNPKLHAKLVEHFFSTEAMNNLNKGFWDALYQSLHPFSVVWSNCLAELKSIRTELNDSINSAINTAILSKKIAISLYKHIESKADLKPIPWQKATLPLMSTEEDSLIQTYKNLYNSQREEMALNGAVDAYSKFQAKLEELTSTSQFFIDNLSKEDKDQLSKLYIKLQPYLHTCIGEHQQQSWRFFDRKLIQALTGDTSWLPENKLSLMIDEIENTLTFFKFKSKLKTQQNKANRLVHKNKQTIKEKARVYKEELEYIEPTEVLERANYVFKWKFVPKVPEWVREKRSELFEWLLQNYGKAITNELVMLAPSGVPYPEVEELLSRLSHPHQLVVIKQVLNALYYLEVSTEYLANLREDSLQSSYMWSLFQTYVGIEQIYKLQLAFRKDPYFLSLVTQIKEQCSRVLRTAYEQTQPYQTSALEVNHHQQQPVKWSALWYTIQTLRIMPKHLAAKLQKKSVSSIAAYDASLSAKQTCLEIEQLIEKSDSYLRLFLSLPQISRLCYQLRDDSLGLAQQAHHAVVDNLKAIHDGTITDILIEADKLEIEVGLNAGTIAEPLYNILSKFFTELVYQQQHLSSKTIFDILYSPIGTQRRQECIADSEGETIQQMNRTKKCQELLEDGFELIDHFYNGPDKLTTNEQYEICTWIKDNINTLKKMEEDNGLPIEVQRKPKTKLEKAVYSITPYLNEYFPNCEFRLRCLRATLEGENASALFVMEKLNLQSNYLAEGNEFSALVANRQTEQMKHFIELQFDKVVSPYLDREIGVENLSEEFSNLLKNYIRKERKNIVSQISNLPQASLVDLDLIQMIDEAAKISLGQFVKIYYDDYVLLSEFLKQLEACKKYCTELSVNEKPGPKQAKYTQFYKLLSELGTIAKDEKLVPTERIKVLKQKTQKDTIFYSRLMNIRNDVGPFTWQWFKQCIEDLLSLLHLRKPTCQQYYENTCASLEKLDLPLNKLYKANGFFSLNFQDNEPMSSQELEPVAPSSHG